MSSPPTDTITPPPARSRTTSTACCRPPRARRATSRRPTGSGTRAMSPRSSRHSASISRPRARLTRRAVPAAIHDATDGYDGDPKLLTAFPTECRGGANCELAQVVEGPIPFAGLCEHHVLPFVGRAWVGYVAHEQIIGISKLTRLVRVLTRRIRRAGAHDPRDRQFAAVDAVRPWHGGLPRGEPPVHPDRGVREHEPMTRTTAWRGAFVADPALRSEFFTMAGRVGAR